MSALRLTAAASVLALMPLAASAQASLWDLFTPDRIVTRLIQVAISGARTQADITYGGISTDLLNGTVTLTDLQAWPRNDWDPDGTCRIAVDRITLRSAAVDEDDVVRLKLQVAGASAAVSCLPPEAQGAVAMLGRDQLDLSRLTLDLDYRISSASLDGHLHARVDGLAAVSVLADFEYLAMEQPLGMGEPLPAAFLREARVTVENLGAWDMVQGMVPPPFTDPAQGGAALAEMLAGVLPPSEAGAALAASAEAGWSAFLADPRQLVLETGLPPGASVYLDPALFDAPDPGPLLDKLKPRLVLKPATVLQMVSLDLLSADPATLSEEDRLSVGVALATGRGAPRDLSRARELLAPLAEAGSGPAAAALARALEVRAPAEAYGHALIAAAAGEPASGALIDRIEAALPFDVVLSEQARKVGDPSAEALESLASIRAEAGARLTGRGQTRSYATAALWAMLGAAAGDEESADILDDLDQRIRLAGPEALAAWEPLEAEAATLARDAWIGFDLPALLGGN